MTQLLAIAAGGAVGALMRYGMAHAVYAWMGRAFPYGTLIVNVSGCLAMGVLYVLLVERLHLDAEWRAGILVGLLGAYTTFSSFTMETLALVEQGDKMRAFVNVLASVTLCLIATWAGVAAARRI